jgi:NADH:ubiquinone oxidoreductase subunit K
MFSVAEFLELLNQQKTILSAMISVSLLLNGALLTFLFQKQLDKMAKGIFFTTCIYAVVAIACKWFL